MSRRAKVNPTPVAFLECDGDDDAPLPQGMQRHWCGHCLENRVHMPHFAGTFHIWICVACGALQQPEPPLPLRIPAAHRVARSKGARPHGLRRLSL